MATTKPRKSPAHLSQDAEARQTILRHWSMLRFVPKGPRTITAPELCRKLANEGFMVSARTVQRDLNELSRHFPLTVNEDGKRPYLWSWGENAPRLDLPGLDPSEALTLLMVERHLANILPVTTRQRLKPHFDLARNTLANQHGARALHSWPDKVRVVPPTQPMKPPDVRPAVQETVHDALLNDRQLKIRYRKKGDDQTSSATIHPLALVQRGAVTYLICTFFDFTDPRLLTLHRIEKAEKLDAPANRPAGFSVDATITSGLLGFRQSEPTRLVVDFFNGAGEHLFETAISAKQTLARLPDNVVRLTTDIPLTQETVWWLLGFGENVEVLEPQSLREQIASTLARAASRYG